MPDWTKVFGRISSFCGLGADGRACGARVAAALPAVTAAPLALADLALQPAGLTCSCGDGGDGDVHATAPDHCQERAPVQAGAASILLS